MTSCFHCAHVPPYKPLCAALFEKRFQSSWLRRELLTYLSSISPNSSSSSSSSPNSSFVQEVTKGVYSFPFLTNEASGMILKEVQHYMKYCGEHDLPIHRPNSMNNYGIVMRQMGLHELILDLQVNYLHPISAELFPLHSNGGFSSHHSFIVSYSTDKDTHLDMHTDDSDVTFNICLGNEGFTASGLTFCGIRGQSNHRKFSCSYQHHIGHAVVHLGEQRHGADVITSGERHNLIIWNKNEAYRQTEAYRLFSSQYEREESQPDEICLSYTHDRDFVVFKDYPSIDCNPYYQALSDDDDEDTSYRKKSLPWCPPPGTEYPNMLPTERIIQILREKNQAQVDAELSKIEGCNHEDEEENKNEF